MKRLKFCSGNCPHLSITEKDQDLYSHKNKPKHICRKYGTQVYHTIYHPNILKCEECLKNALKKSVIKSNNSNSRPIYLRRSDDGCNVL